VTFFVWLAAVQRRQVHLAVVDAAVKHFGSKADFECRLEQFQHHEQDQSKCAATGTGNTWS
jgi:hypothetical protein